MPSSKPNPCVNHQVCRLLASVIDESARLQYEIELATAGMENASTGGMSTSERRIRLKEYTSRWRTLNFPVCTTLRKRDDHRVIYCTVSDGYVLAQVTNSNVIELTRFPSHIRGVPYKSWSISGATIGIIIGICAVDSSQNLLVASEEVENVDG